MVPIWFDENIRDREVKERVMQLHIQHKIKQYPLPEILKQPRKPPVLARLPTANLAQELDLIEEDLY
jgi:hypothetical protein